MKLSVSLQPSNYWSLFLSINMFMKMKRETKAACKQSTSFAVWGFDLNLNLYLISVVCKHLVRLNKINCINKRCKISISAWKLFTKPIWIRHNFSTSKMAIKIISAKNLEPFMSRETNEWVFQNVSGLKNHKSFTAMEIFTTLKTFQSKNSLNFRSNFH